MTFVHRCLIVSADHVEIARVLCETLAGPGGSGMFITPLSHTGQEPATHFISSGAIEEPFAQLLPLAVFPADAEPMTTPGNAELVEQLAAEAGYPTTAAEVKALFDASDITEQDPQQAMQRLGLAMVQPALPATSSDLVE